MEFRTFKLRRDPKCPVCGENPTITDLVDYDQFCGIPQAAAEEAAEEPVPEITVQELKTKIDREGEIRAGRCAREIRIRHLPHPRLEVNPAGRDSPRA